MVSLSDVVDMTYVLNMDADKDRLLLSLSGLDILGITLWDRLRGRTIGEGKTLKDRERGCQDSHIRVVKKALAEGYNYILVFEDDFSVKMELLSFVSQVIDFVKNEKFDILYLSSNLFFMAEKGYLPYTPEVVDGYANIFRIKRAFCLAAYILPRHLFEKFILLENKDEPIDVLVRDYIQNEGNCFALVPSMITQRPGKSRIQGKDVDYSGVIV